jgi:hypothetical protein
MFFLAAGLSARSSGCERFGCDRRINPLLTEEGWLRHQENTAKHPLKERTGWSIYRTFFVMRFASSLTTPSARNKDASRNFHDRASTPLKELDVTRVPPQASTPFDLQAIVVFGNAVVVYAFQVSQRRFRHKAGESSRGDKRSEPVCELYS